MSGMKYNHAVIADHIFIYLCCLNRINNCFYRTGGVVLWVRHVYVQLKRTFVPVLVKTVHMLGQSSRLSYDIVALSAAGQLGPRAC